MLRLVQPRCIEQGKLTIGYGRNIEDIGISEAESGVLLTANMKEATDDLLMNFAWFSTLSDARQRALSDMRFQLGAAGFRAFKATIAALAIGDFQTAAGQILASKYAEQVPSRAKEIAQMIETGKDL